MPIPAISPTVAAALEELDLIAVRIAVDARRAIESFEMLEASNKPVVDALKDVETDTAFGHRYVQNAAGVMLAMEVSRLFDQGGQSISRQTKASFPILSHRLSDPTTRAVVISHAVASSPQRHAECMAGLTAYDAQWSNLLADARLQDAIRRLRTLRDYEIAHSIYDKNVDPPTYRDLFDLMGAAVRLADAATQAVNGGRTYFSDFQDDRRDSASAFWQAYVHGVRAEGEGDLTKRCRTEMPPFP